MNKSFYLLLAVLIAVLLSIPTRAQQMPMFDLTQPPMDETTAARYADEAKARLLWQEREGRPATVTLRQDEVLARSVSKPQEPRLRVVLNELSAFQEAARQAGGKVEISIKPVGVTTQEIAAQLAKMESFEVEQSQDGIILVKSRSDAPFIARVNQLREEAGKLQAHCQTLWEQKQTLAQDIESMRGVLSELVTQGKAQVAVQSQHQSSGLLQGQGTAVPSAIQPLNQPQQPPAIAASTGVQNFQAQAGSAGVHGYMAPGQVAQTRAQSGYSQAGKGYTVYPPQSQPQYNAATAAQPQLSTAQRSVEQYHRAATSPSPYTPQQHTSVAPSASNGSTITLSPKFQGLR